MGAGVQSVSGSACSSGSSGPALHLLISVEATFRFIQSSRVMTSLTSWGRPFGGGEELRCEGVSAGFDAALSSLWAPDDNLEGSPLQEPNGVKVSGKRNRQDVPSLPTSFRF